MPRYRVLEKSFLRPAPRPGRADEPARLYEVGAEIDSDQAPGPSLLPLDAAACQATAREMYAKALRRGGGSGHRSMLKWSALIGEPRDTDHAREMIRNFIAQHHPDPKIRKQAA
jgi:hypothetical protein